ncbi:MAG: hypothetical protein Q8N89_06285 [Azonexus sp.]|nr:hypothetical protein [Azonexus sp.]
MLSRARDLLIAVAALAAGGILAWHYPLGSFAAPVLFLAASALAFHRPAWLLVIIPALLPVIGLAPWTGWLSFEEVDMLVLATAGGGYARMLVDGPPASSPRRAWLLTGLAALMALSLLVSMARGFADAGGFVFGWYQGYDGPMNSIRIGKSFFLALLLVPLLNRLQGHPANQASNKLALGLVIGLGTASLAALWERLAFTDLLNFSSDYRSTALFWEMHVGGAALDGWLLLTMPFAIWALRHARTPAQHALSLALIVIAAYAALTTFSRGVYLALIVALPLLAWQTRTHAGAAGQGLERQAWSPLRWGIALLLLATMAGLVFFSGGYRGLMALLGVVAVALVLPQALRGIAAIQLVAGGVLGMMLGGLLVLLAGFLPKGSYILHFAVFAALLLFLLWPRGGRLQGRQGNRRLYCAAGFFVLLVSAANVADHWGGSDALWGMLGALVVVLAVALGSVFSARPAWPNELPWQGTFMSAAVAVSAVIAVFIGGGYMGDRFSTSSKDLDGRFDHWNLSLSMLQTPLDHAFGKGLGRYPANYFFAIPDSKFPGTYQIIREGDGAWLSLVGARHPMSFGDVLRVSQRLDFAAAGPFEVTLKIRAKTDVSIHVEVCEKHLLYVAGCAIGRASAKAGEGGWQSASIKLAGPVLSGGPWYATRIKMFSLAIGNQSGVAEIDDVALAGPGGEPLLANGDFSNDMQHWFFSSDRDHMPWHAKNILVNVLFDQGYVGLALFLLLTAGALWRLNLGKARQHELAPYLSAAIIGFLVVGMFDSLIDVPRLALVYYLLLMLALSSLAADKHEMKGVGNGH